MTFDEFCSTEREEDTLLDVCREKARRILAEMQELMPQERYAKLKSPSNCYAIVCIYNQHGYAGVMEWIKLGKRKPRG